MRRDQRGGLFGRFFVAKQGIGTKGIALPCLQVSSGLLIQTRVLLPLMSRLQALPVGSVRAAPRVLLFLHLGPSRQFMPVYAASNTSVRLGFLGYFSLMHCPHPPPPDKSLFL